jgi:hypothetical protein
MERENTIFYCDSKHPICYPKKDYDYSRMNFSDRDLRKLDLRNVCISNCNFHRARLDYTNLEGANLENCDLSETSFRETNIRGCNLEFSKTSGADFSGAVFDSSTTLPFSHDEAIKMGMIYKTGFRDLISIFAEGGVSHFNNLHSIGN